jgi:hypothetical protein
MKTCSSNLMGGGGVNQVQKWMMSMRKVQIKLMWRGVFSKARQSSFCYLDVV